MNDAVKAFFSTSYWPPVACFAVMGHSGEWVLEKHEHYQKQTIRNRCSICGANGPQWLVIPVLRSHGQKTPVGEVMLDSGKDWQRVHRLAIESAYGSSPYYEYYRDEIMPFYEIDYPLSLFDYNTSILKWCLEALDSKIKISFTRSYLPYYEENDYRSKLPLHVPLPYYQVFTRKHGFVPGQSILDLLMNEGPESWKFLEPDSKCQDESQT
ncbi:MAG: WbqC family protein [Bacteroidales bacterium]|nr:WbqC family protein [Bacteroidales bacterium]